MVNLLEHFAMVEFFFSEYKELKEIAVKEIINELALFLIFLHLLQLNGIYLPIRASHI